MKAIRKARREWFGGVLYSEQPGMTLFLDHRQADRLGLPPQAGLQEGVFSAPLDAHLSLTTRCNLHCRGCYAPHDAAAARDMPLDLARRILDNLASLDVFTVAFGGGEPLLYPHLFEVAEYARSRRIVPNLTTNGELLDARSAKQCRAFGAVHLSWHGPGDCGRLERAAAALRTAGIAPGLNVLLSRQTVERLPQVFDWAARQSFERLLLLKFKLTATNAGCRDMAMLPEQEKGLYPAVKRLARRHGVVLMVDCSLLPALAVHRVSDRMLRFFEVGGCRGGNVFMAVDVEGNCRPCSFWPESFARAETLTATEWRGSPALESFRGGRAGPACSDCRYGELCNGGCRLTEREVCGVKKVASAEVLASC